MSFTYNDEGLRTSKTANGATTKYYYDGDLLIKEETSSYTIVYVYDISGVPLSFRYRSNSYAEGVWDIYYYGRNLQNDIIAVYNSAGTKLISYKYTAYGKTTVSYSNSGSSTTATKNSLRYRGYYYDSDLGFYYLQSRYYDPNTCRFINADDSSLIVASPIALTDKNLFSYCDNNPVMRVDHSGYFWGTVFDVISLGFSIAEVVNNPDDIWAWIGLAGDIVDLVPIVSGVGEATDIIRIANKADDVVDTIDNVADTIDNVADTTKVGWKLGDDITNLTKAGKTPSWSTVRQRFWKNEALNHASSYSSENLLRMKKGLAPIVGDFSMELHHTFGRNGKNFFIFEALTKEEHFLRHYGRIM